MGIYIITRVLSKITFYLLQDGDLCIYIYYLLGIMAHIMESQKPKKQKKYATQQARLVRRSKAIEKDLGQRIHRFSQAWGCSVVK